MLIISLSESDDYPAVDLLLEHSLVSLSKWESKYKKPFFSKDSKSGEESFEYIKAMLLNEFPPEDLSSRLENEHVDLIGEYINDPQTATTFREMPGTKAQTETISSELIYFWLVQFRIPFQPTETWHLNRIMTLVKIAGIKQTKPKKMGSQAQAELYRAENERRRRELGTSG